MHVITQHCGDTSPGSEVLENQRSGDQGYRDEYSQNFKLSLTPFYWSLHLDLHATVTKYRSNILVSFSLLLTPEGYFSTWEKVSWFKR